MVEDLKRNVYKNLNCLAPFEDHSLIGRAVLTSNLQIGLSHIRSSSQQNMNYSDEQGMNHQIVFCSHMPPFTIYFSIFFYFVFLLNLLVVGGGDGGYGKSMLLTRHFDASD